MVVELHVGKAEFIHLRAGIFISEKRRVAFNEGIELFLV